MWLMGSQQALPPMWLPPFFFPDGQHGRLASKLVAFPTRAFSSSTTDIGAMMSRLWSLLLFYDMEMVTPGHGPWRGSSASPLLVATKLVRASRDFPWHAAMQPARVSFLEERLPAPHGMFPR